METVVWPEMAERESWWRSIVDVGTGDADTSAPHISPPAEHPDSDDQLRNIS
jgi:hypothetical protein